MNIQLMPTPRDRDVSGFKVFSCGDAGAAHTMAHRMLDEGRHELGHRLLGGWLEGRSGAGSEWTHLQWHMAIFEIAVGEWETALDRFEREILPVALCSEDALTDGPGMIWWLWLSAPREVELPWTSLGTMALRNLGKHDCAYVELHCLLAVAGSRDVDALDQWLRSTHRFAEREAKLLGRLGLALRAFAAADYGTAAFVLESCLDAIAELGGSHAQNLLFRQIEDYCRRHAMLARAA